MGSLVALSWTGRPIETVEGLAWLDCDHKGCPRKAHRVLRHHQGGPVFYRWCHHHWLRYLQHGNVKKLIMREGRASGLTVPRGSDQPGPAPAA